MQTATRTKGKKRKEWSPRYEPHANEVRVAPAPEECPHCGGTRFEPDEESGEIPCFVCDGTGVKVARFDILHTRTYGRRRVRYTPSCASSGLLEVGCALDWAGELKWDAYQVVETGNDWKGRSFLVRKLNPEPGEEEHRDKRVILTRDEVSCDCKGSTYLSTARANQAAFDEGRKVFYSKGCKHLDALDALVKGRWFDL